jgi:CelD/BcsL family acetyltransferase involved in cellulose biosynthesis
VTSPQFQITVTSDFSTLTELWPTMSQAGLGAHAPRAYVFQCREFIEVWLRTIGAAKRVEPAFVLVCDQCSQPLMLLPLGIERRGGVRVVRMLDGGVSDYNAPILFVGASRLDENATREIWRRVCEALPAFDVVILEKVPAVVVDMPNPIRLIVSEREANSGHVVTLSGTADEFSRSRNPDFRDSSRKRRRLAELGPVRFLIGAEGKEADRILETLVRQKARRYLETRGVNGFDRPGAREYFKKMTTALLPSGHVHISACFVGDEIIATHWGFVAANRFYWIMPAYEGGVWSKYSAGRLLMEELISWAYGEGLAVFDLGIGDEPYKFKISDSVVELFRGVTANTRLGKIFVVLNHWRRYFGTTNFGICLKDLRVRARKFLSQHSKSSAQARNE